MISKLGPEVYVDDKGNLWQYIESSNKYYRLVRRDWQVERPEGLTRMIED